MSERVLGIDHPNTITEYVRIKNRLNLMLLKHTVLILRIHIYQQIIHLIHICLALLSN